MKPFVVNRHGRLVFPSNFLPELDFSIVGDLERLDAVIGRDFEAKAPTGTDILEAIEAGGYESRYELIRAVALSGLTRETDRSRSIGAGFNMHLNKPVDADSLVAAIARLVGKKLHVCQETAAT